MMTTSGSLTELISLWQKGEITDFSELYNVVYNELKEIANRECYRLHGSHTYSSTGLVNETYLKLVNQKSLNLQDRNHFFAVAATAMRHILINHINSKNAHKRGGNWLQVSLAEISNLSDSEQSEEQILAVNQAVEELKILDESLAKLVEMRFFAGMTEEEVAEVNQCSTRTVRRNWKMAKALLQQILEVS